MKINANFKAFASVHFDASKYIPSPSMGVNRFMLDRIGNEKARATTIVEYKAGSKFPEHTHVGGEEFLVLKGTFKDEHGAFRAGTYCRNPIGSKHSPWVDEDGCTIFVKLLQMYPHETVDKGIKPLYVEYNYEKESKNKVMELYKNEDSGEHVQMLWFEPNQEFSVYDSLQDNERTAGAEILVIEGTLTHDNVVYNAWDWLRFPSSDTGTNYLLFSGTNGVQFYRKVGHLSETSLGNEAIQIHDE